MKHYFFISERNGRKTVLNILPGQTGMNGLPILTGEVKDLDGKAAAYPPGTVFASCTLRTMHKGHGSWQVTEHLKPLTAAALSEADRPGDAMVRKWIEYSSVNS